MTILTKTFKDVTIFSDKMKCFSLQTNNHGLHNGDQSRVDRGNGLSEFCKSAHISFCFIYKSNKVIFSQWKKTEVQEWSALVFPLRRRQGCLSFSFYGLCAWLGSNPLCKNATHTGCGPTLTTSFECNCLFKDPTSKYCYILSWDSALDFTRALYLNLLMSLEETQSIPKETHSKLTNSVKTGSGSTKSLFSISQA